MRLFWESTIIDQRRRDWQLTLIFKEKSSLAISPLSELMCARKNKILGFGRSSIRVRSKRFQCLKSQESHCLVQLLNWQRFCFKFFNDNIGQIITNFFWSELNDVDTKGIPCNLFYTSDLRLCFHKEMMWTVRRLYTYALACIRCFCACCEDVKRPWMALNRYRKIHEEYIWGLTSALRTTVVVIIEIYQTLN